MTHITIYKQTWTINSRARTSHVSVLKSERLRTLFQTLITSLYRIVQYYYTIICM